MTTTVHIGLGSNLGDRLSTLRRAIDALVHTPGIRVDLRSPVLEYPAWGHVPQGPYLNAVARLEVTHDPRRLLELLLAIERSLGRDRAREQRWGPRTLDLDLLLYGDRVIEEPGLRVPHPWLTKRRFVLEPLSYLTPHPVIPGCTHGVAELLSALSSEAPGTRVAEL